MPLPACATRTSFLWPRAEIPRRITTPTPFYPASYRDLDNVITVAATDPNDQLAGYSDYGSNTVDLAAPGFIDFFLLERLGQRLSGRQRHLDGLRACDGCGCVAARLLSRGELQTDHPADSGRH